MSSFQSRAAIALLLSQVLPVSAAPAKTATKLSAPTGVVLAIQPNDGGGAADDCGNGPISLNQDTWASHNMDQLIGGIFDQRMSDPNFDFHQEFGNKYGVDFYCPNSFDNCDTTPSSCSSLTKGTPTEKEQGWLGIKAMMNVQQMFLQWEKVASNAVDSLTSSSTNFQSLFAPTTPGTPLVQKTILNGIIGAVTVVGVLLASKNPSLAIKLGVAGAGGAPIAGFINDKGDSLETPELSVLEFSDYLPQLKQAALSGFEASHNATFSNGQSGGISGTNMKDMLANGAFSGGEVLQAYSGGENSLENFYERYMAIKLLEAYWAAQGAFFIYIPNVTGDCSGWHKNTGDHDVLRFCGQNGMLIMAAVDHNGQFGQPKGVSNSNVASIGSYNIQLQELYESTYNIYTGHGLLSYQDIGYHFNGMVQKFVVEGDHDGAYKSTGFFTLPVCELKAWDWKQSDKMNSEAPCDCLCATDAWGHKFIDVAPDSVKNWLATNKKCPACQ
ncbi:hypothetical protein GGR54DRAFT_577085 [Hypoxylon sp. NC1633]|nr:hypothetical protein GGR54DRAFT_577085 [Hypoxylon sp. NC1633]